MKRCSQLLESCERESPHELQESAQAGFIELLREYGIPIAIPSKKPSFTENLVVVGVAASFSKSDLALMDEIIGGIQEDNVTVFDASALDGMDEFEDYIPGITPVHHTPVVGVWKDGSLAAKKSGKEARDFLRERYRTGP